MYKFSLKTSLIRTVSNVAYRTGRESSNSYCDIARPSWNSSGHLVESVSVVGFVRVGTSTLLTLTELQFSLERRVPALIPVILAEQNLLKGLAKHLVKYRVEDGVHHGASVAEPGGKVEHALVDALFTLGTERRQ